MKRRTIILVHLLFWVLYALVPELPYLFPDRKYPVWLYHYNITTEAFNILNFYVVYLLIRVNFFRRERITGSLVLLLGIVLTFSTMRIWGTRMVSIRVSGMEELPSLRFVNMIVEVVNSMLFSTFAVLMKFMIDWFATQKVKAELLAQKQQSELALLRTQVNPHFLFNTLNNLYSLVYRKSDTAAPVVMKLSEIMRYMLYDAVAEKVPLDKEITYLRSFIELQELRMREKDFIAIRVTGVTDEKMIPPMLLIPFVENAIKHGRKDVPSPGIAICLDVSGESLTFEITNYCNPGNGVAKDPYQGIGLQNVTRRLQLMYPGSHQLSITPCGDQFTVKLFIAVL